MNTYLGRLERKARREGMIEGRQERRQEGWRESRKESLRLVLRSRFGNLPEALEIALSTITEPDRLDALIQRAAIAASLDEVRADLES